MLEIKSLSKRYRPKKGLPVTALDQVSLTFPEKGMVFIVGKSGCGKSTLLNLLGGLDSYDSGEIIISGKSSKAFRQSDFDSYRNTLVGFIFQEYNVLDEFTVGANIALALELQGKKALDDEISRILEQVDLVGYGNRRPNELSGGQKQRVAIARALVKNPKIIMADEPTGALDSNTGRQVLDTLKKLSHDKLVIVVSHDIDFAHQYADRIVELSDGKVLSDREYASRVATEEADGITFEQGEVRVSRGYRLTEEDREAINAYLSSLETGEEVVIRGKKSKERVGREAGKPDLSHLNPIRFIPSRLPMKAAFRIGCGALKHKKIRLAFTILLSCIAFGLFGLADTFGAYDHITTCTRSILDSSINYVSFAKTQKHVYGEGEEDFYYSRSGKIRQEELSEISKRSGVSLQGVFVPYQANLEFTSLYDNEAEFTKSDFHIYPYGFNGFSELSSDMVSANSLRILAGRLPEGDKNEIAITSYICETFYIGGFARQEDGKTVYDKVSVPEDMLGKVIPLNGVDYTVVGVLDSGFDLDRYRPLTEEIKDESTADLLVSYALMQELSGIREYSMAQIAFVGQGHLDALLEKEPQFLEAENGYFELQWIIKDHGEEYRSGTAADRYGTLQHRGDYEIAWADGEKESLAENEVVVSLEFLSYIVSGFSAKDGKATEENVIELPDFSKGENEEFFARLKEMQPLFLSVGNWYQNENPKEIENATIVGVLLPDEKAILPEPGIVLLGNEALIGSIARLHDGVFRYAVGQMPKTYGEVEQLVRFSNEEGDVRYELQNPVTFELEAIHEVLLVLSKVFLYVGIGFAVFASFLLANFIGTSIAYKKQQIGILRAIGARSNDVFRIFFAESFVIAIINFILSAVGTFAVVSLINYVVRTETGILITILTFSFRQVALLLAASVLVAALASFIPVKKIASKRPIDAIRDR